ncbi:cytochrome P450 [Gigaspora margarita]|uniref:Cytochrome P450 n=1 Tax=Gigaspora margarita TaxID=4874 RepID=A0A8H3X810_GIGMA|nr:cytochrome P450 [Gigaspora margarita]
MSLHKYFENLSFVDYFHLVVLFILFYVIKFYYKYFTRPNKLPGPLPIPIIECAYCFRGDFKQLFVSLNKKYGDIYEIQLGGYRRIVLSRPEYIEKFFNNSTKHAKFMPRAPYSRGMKELLMGAKGLATSDDFKSWKFNRQFVTRAILSPSFNNEAIKWTKLLFEELEGYWKSLGSANSDDKKWTLETDFSKWIHRFTNDMIVISTTGERSYSIRSYYNTLSPIKTSYPDALIEDSDRFVKGINQVVAGIAFFAFLGPFVRHYIPFFRGKAKEILNHRDFLYERLDKIIKKRRQEIEVMPNKDLKNDMLTSLIIVNTERDVNYKKDVGEEIFPPMTDIEIRANILDAFLAGTDTTANLFCYITYYLCHYPEVKQKMLAEINSIFLQNSSFQLVHSDLSKLKYCEAIIKEVERMIPVVNLLGRYPTEPIEVGGYQWLANTMFQFDLVSLHRHKDYWPNPEIFDPNRFFLDNNKSESYLNVKNDDLKDDHNEKDDQNIGQKYSFVMFGGGYRICPGRKLAMIELLSLMVYVFGKYNVELIDMKAPLKTRSSTITSCQELMVKIKPRNQ